MDALEKLLAIEAIKVLKARYFRLMDTKDWGGFEELFVPDVVIDFPDDIPGATPSRGRDGFVNGLKAAAGPSLTLHHGHMPEIEILSPTTARGIWAMQDWVISPIGGLLGTFSGWGHYHETYRKTADRWQIETMRLTRLKVDRQ